MCDEKEAVDLDELQTLVDPSCGASCSVSGNAWTKKDLWLGFLCVVQPLLRQLNGSSDGGGS